MRKRNAITEAAGRLKERHLLRVPLRRALVALCGFVALAALLLLPGTARAWDIEWGDEWGVARAECEDCGYEYEVSDCNSTSEAQEQLQEYFCEGCGFCSKDGNEECWDEHHCQKCGDCLDEGDYHDGYYDLTGLKVCDNCWEDVKSDLSMYDEICPHCEQLYDIDGESACDCEMFYLVPHCTACSEDECSVCGMCLIIAGEDWAGAIGCEDHMICTMCYDQVLTDGIHCALCSDCDGIICEECYLCDNCATDLHCESCERCWQEKGGVDMCPSGGDHCEAECEENSWICSECNECTEGQGLDMCDDCGLCDACCQTKSEAKCDHGFCLESSEYDDHLCPECDQCDGGEMCDDCGLCKNCQDGYHCEHELCPEGSDWDEHLCSDCGDCFELSDLCELCGRCEDCQEHCEHDLCSASDEYEEHFCNLCDNCFEMDELCEHCGRCEDCQEHCEHDYCPEDDNYEDGGHFVCEQCGDCYDGDRCDDCELCQSCCEDNTSDIGCDHDLCVESSEFAEHWCYEDEQCLENCEHNENCDHLLTSGWKSNDNAHWKECLECGKSVERGGHRDGELVTITGPNAINHKSGTSQLNCAVCEAKMALVSVPYVPMADNGAPYIIVQPTDYTGKVSDVQVVGIPRYATFTVKAGGDNLKYQWYLLRTYYNGTTSTTKLVDERGDNWGYNISGKDDISGAQTNKLTVYVEAYSCYEKFEYYCEVSNANGTVNTRNAKLNSQHTYGMYREYVDGDECEDEEGKAVHATKDQHWYFCIGDGCPVVKKASKHRYGQWELVRAATDKQTGLREQRCTDCRHKNSEIIPKVEPGHVHVYNLYRTSPTQHWCYCACGVSKSDEAEDHTYGAPVVTKQPTENNTGSQKSTCTVCSFEKTEQLAKQPHTHDWYSFDEVVYWNSKTMKYETDTDKGSRSSVQHLVHCKGCDAVKTIAHCWTDFVGVADATAEKSGRVERLCGICQYREVMTNPVGTWPVMVNGGTAYTLTYNSITSQTVKRPVTYAKPGMRIYLEYDTSYGVPTSEMYSYLGTPYLCLKEWRDLKGYWGENDIPWGKGDKIIPELTFTKLKASDNSFSLITIPTTFSAYFTMPDGPAIVIADVEKCSHPKSAQGFSAAIAPTCTSYGSAKGFMCTLCGKETVPGARIEALGHDLPSTPIAGTARVEYCTKLTASGNQKNTAKNSYEGDFVCNRCNKTVKGKNLPLEHGRYISESRVDTFWYNLVSTKLPTCTQDGYSGNLECRYCNKTVSRGEKGGVDRWGNSYAAVGHSWGEWETVREATPKQKGVEKRVCYHEDTWFSWKAGEHEETRLVDYAPEYGLKAPKTKLVFEWEYGKTPATQTLAFTSIGRNALTAIEQVKQEVDGVATVKISGTTLTVKPIESGVVEKWGTSGKETLTLTMATSEAGSLTDDEFAAQPIELVMRIKKAAPALEFAETEQTIIVGNKAASPQIEGAEKGMTFSWYSSDNSIAVVDPTGEVKALKPGTVTITAKFDGNRFYTSGTASYTLNVGDKLPTSIQKVEAGTSNTVTGTYDLSGRKVEKVHRPDVYIRDGKKVLVKKK